VFPNKLSGAGITAKDIDDTCLILKLFYAVQGKKVERGKVPCEQVAILVWTH